MSDVKVKVSVELVAQALQKTLDSIVQKTDDVDKGLKKIKGSGKDTFSEIAVHIGKASGIYDIFVGNLAANLATKAFDVLADGASHLFQIFVTEGVTAAKKQEEAVNALNISLAQSGIYSKDTSEKFEKFASDLQATTGVQDDVILQNAALIQSLGRLDEEGLKRATRAAIDMSAALGKDLATSAEILGKAANGNVTSLEKLGINIVKGRTDAETFERALSALEARFSGAGKDSVNTYAGAIKLTEASFEDLQKSVGQTIVQNAVVVAVWKEAGSILNDTTSSVQNNKQSLKQLVADGLILAIQGVNLFIVALDTLTRIGTFTFRTLMTAVYGFGSLVFGILAQINPMFQSSFDKLTNAADEALKSVGKSLYEDTKLGETSAALIRLENVAKDSLGTLGSESDKAGAHLKNNKDDVEKLTKAQEEHRKALESWVQTLVKAGEDGEAQYQSQLELLKARKDEEILVNQNALFAISDAEKNYLDAKTAADEEYFAKQQARLNESRALGQKDAEEYATAQVVLDQRQYAKRKQAAIEMQQFEHRMNQSKLQATSDTLGNLATLMQTSNRSLFEAGRAAAIAQATINTIVGVSNALAGPPTGPVFPFNIILAASQAVALGVQVAKLTSAQPPSFADGGIVPGSSFNGDRVQANVNSGEMILNRTQQTKLFNLVSGGGSSSDGRVEQLINMVGAMLAQPISVQVSGKDLFNITRGELQAGRSFA